MWREGDKQGRGGPCEERARKRRGRCDAFKCRGLETSFCGQRRWKTGINERYKELKDRQRGFMMNLTQVKDASSVYGVEEA